MSLENLLNKICIKVEHKKQEDAIKFTFDNNDTAILEHDQECCENVELIDICGDLEDLIGSPLLVSEEISGGFESEPKKIESYQEEPYFTFYRFGTKKGYVTILFRGQSNGYYGVSASLKYNKLETEIEK